MKWELLKWAFVGFRVLRFPFPVQGLGGPNRPECAIIRIIRVLAWRPLMRWMVLGLFRVYVGL